MILMKGIKKVVLEENMEISKEQNYRKSEGLSWNTATHRHRHTHTPNTVDSANKSLKD